MNGNARFHNHNGKEFLRQRVRGKKSRAGERGQAVTELVVSLIGILVVFLGLLLISALGIENVRNVIEARAAADRAASSGYVGGDRGQYIIDWDYGPDGIPFTADDVPNTAVSSQGDVFIPQLTDSSGEFSLVSSLNGSSYVNPRNNFAPDLSAVNLFTVAATLSSGTETQNDPLSERGLSDLKEAVRRFLTGGDFHLEDTAYMPLRASSDTGDAF